MEKFNFKTQNTFGIKFEEKKYGVRPPHPEDERAIAFVEGLTDFGSILGFVIRDRREHEEAVDRLEKNFEALRRYVERLGDDKCRLCAKTGSSS